MWLDSTWLDFRRCVGISASWPATLQWNCFESEMRLTSEMSWKFGSSLHAEESETSAHELLNTLSWARLNCSAHNSSWQSPQLWTTEIMLYTTQPYFQLVHIIQTFYYLPSVLWRCWLGDRKGIRPVKKLGGGVLPWLSVWDEVQICISPNRCHCQSLSLAPVNPDWFYPSGTSSPGQSQKKRREP